jgi:hypothetical protein
MEEIRLKAVGEASKYGGDKAATSYGDLEIWRR